MEWKSYFSVTLLILEYSTKSQIYNDIYEYHETLTISFSILKSCETHCEKINKTVVGIFSLF